MAEEQKNTIPPVVLNSQQLQLNVQLLYATGTTINISSSDAQIIFNTNGRPLIVAAMSLPVAKQLKAGLEKAISDYEIKTNSIVLDASEIAEMLKQP